jgi:hypothetical protein
MVINALFSMENVLFLLCLLPIIAVEIKIIVKPVLKG